MNGSVGQPAHAIAAQVRAGTLAPRDVVQAHLEHIAVLDDGIGAFQRVRAAAALREAEALAARPDLALLPLAGVPVAVKDNIPVAGEPLGNGSAGSAPTPAPADHEVVRRLRAAGAIVIGLTRVPELCLWPFADGAPGTARNPWNPARAPGGSSGGSAAAVAAGMVPVAHGADGLGSIRIPAAACGLVGLKPGAGVVPSAIGRGSWYGMSENGALATCVADAALLHAVLAGRPEPFALAPPQPLRIALSIDSPVPGARTDAGVAAAVRSIASLLQSMGHAVEPLRIDAPTGVALSVFAHWFAGAALDAEDLAAPDRMLPATRGHVAAGRWVRRLGLVRPGAGERWRAQLLDRLAGCDLLLTPTTATTAVAADGWSRRGWLATLRAAVAHAPFTGAANFAGLPALSLPAGRHDDGLPIGAHLVGRGGDEGLLLAVAAQVEQARPWPRHAPGCTGGA